MTHPALATVGHRPWPVPERAWALSMRWEDLLFLHWPVAAAALRPFVPPQLSIDTFDGTAWLGVVPFQMSGTRFRRCPPVPTATRFAELNLRTYVTAAGRPGVWFFSLDAHSALAVEGARRGFGLPYFRARMQVEVERQHVRYRSERADRRAPPAVFRGSWRPSAHFRPALAGSLEHFLLERYCLYAERRGQLVCGDVTHSEWQLAPAEVDLEVNDMARLVDLELHGPPVSALATRDQDVVGWLPVPWPPRA